MLMCTALVSTAGAGEAGGGAPGGSAGDEVFAEYGNEVLSEGKSAGVEIGVSWEPTAAPVMHVIIV